jgi:HK97 family phage portal protein
LGKGLLSLTTEAAFSVLNKSLKNSGAFTKYFVTKRAEPPARNTKEWLKRFTESPRLSPVGKMAIDIATTKGKVVKVQKNGVVKEQDNHPLLDLLYKPNEEFNLTGTTSLYLCQLFYLIKGEAFGIIERDLEGLPGKLMFVPPNWVTLPSKEEEKYKIDVPQGQTFYVHPDDMFYRKNPNPANPSGRGIGRVEALSDEIDTDEFMAKYAKTFFYNDATPNLVITAPDNASDEEIKKSERKWFQKFGGFLNSSRAAFLNWDAKIQLLNTSNREMDFIESRKFYRDLVGQFFGIPPEIMGNVENSNKATVVAARDIYRNEVLNPMFIEFEEAITWQLLRKYPNSENLMFVFERKEEDNDEFQLKVLNQSFERGGLTVGEYRIGVSKLLKHDLEPFDDELNDSLIIPSNKMVINTKKPLKEQLEEQRATSGNNNGGKDDE